MKESPFKSASDYLKPSHKDLQTVLSKVKAIENLNQQVLPLLDPAIQKYCQVANLHNGVLVILATNGSAATGLRYQSADLIKKLHKSQSFKHIKQVEIKVRPKVVVDVERGPAARITEKAEPLSAGSAQILLEMAETIEDEGIREIMRRIAGHTLKTNI
jgi:hypothetical protein